MEHMYILKGILLSLRELRDLLSRKETYKSLSTASQSLYIPTKDTDVSHVYIVKGYYYI